MPDLHPHQAEATIPGHQACEALLAGVLAAAKAALPHQGLDLLVWGAARLGDQATLRHLLSNGGSSSWAPSKDENEEWEGDTCLLVASAFGHEGVVKELLESGVDVDEEREDDGVTALYSAADNGHEGVVEILLKAGADVNKAMTHSGATPLYISAQEGHEGVVEQLLKAGANPNTEKIRGRNRTPLMTATAKGHSRVCSLLLEAGAHVNRATDANEGTALKIAVASGHREAALVLMEHGASSGNETLTPSMLEDLKKWMVEALKENKRIVAEKDRQMEIMVQGIPEWCAQAASSVAAEGQNGGPRSSNAPDAPPQPSRVGRKRKAPSAAE